MVVVGGGGGSAPKFLGGRLIWLQYIEVDFVTLILSEKPSVND